MSNNSNPLTHGGILQVESLEATLKNVTFDASTLRHIGSLEYKFLCSMEKLLGRTLHPSVLRDVFMKVTNGNQ